MAPCRAVVAAYATAMVGSLQYGYHHAIYNQPMRVMQRLVNHSYFESVGRHPTPYFLSWMWSLTVALFAGGLVLGGICGSSVLVDRFGRKTTLVLAALIGILGAGVQAAAFYVPRTTFVSLPLGRLVTGISVGVGINAQVVYLSEIRPEKVSYGLLTVTVALGNLLANVLGRRYILGNIRHWYILPTVSAGFLAMFLIIALCIHDTPIFLLERRKREDLAMESLKYYNYNKKRKDMTDLLRTMKEESKKESDNVGLSSLMGLIGSDITYFRALWAALLFALLVPFSGMFVVYSYLVELITSAGLTVRMAEVISTMVPTVDLIYTFVGVFFMDYSGRKHLAMYGAWLSAICLGVCFVTQAVLDELPRVFLVQCAFVVALVVFVMVKALTISNISWVLPSEVFPTSFRTGAVASYVCLLALTVDFGNFILLLLYVPAKALLGGYSFLMFIIPLMVIAILLTVYNRQRSSGTHVCDIYQHCCCVKMNGHAAMDPESRERLMSDTAAAYGTFIEGDEEKGPAPNGVAQNGHTVKGSPQASYQHDDN